MSDPATAPRRPAVGVALFLLDGEGRFALMLRRGSHGAGRWGLVGGHQELWQSPQQAARDEALQELGVTLDPAEIACGPWTDDQMPDEDRHYVTLFVSTRLPAGQVPGNREPHKCDAFGFFGIGDLPGPLFGPLANFLRQPVRPPFA